MSIDWTAEEVARLDPKFLEEVRHRTGDRGSVQFGRMGEGHRPNYQVRHADGKSIAYNGMNHEPFLFSDGQTEFEAANLSDEFTLEEIEQIRFGKPSAPRSRDDATDLVLDHAERKLDRDARKKITKHREELIELARTTAIEAAFDQIRKKYGL